MSQSKIFQSNNYSKIELAIVNLLNDQPDFLSGHTIESPRAVGDAIQNILSEKFRDLLGDYCNEYSASFARRAMADLAFTDKDGLYYCVDVKTHRADTKFNMPNLTSVERLARFYEEDNNFFCVLMVRYVVQGAQIVVDKVHFVPIEFLSWDCLTIGALGWGQIQIANANVITVDDSKTRKQWMLELCDTLLEFYPKEISKITVRIEYFKKVRSKWQDKPDE